MQKNTNLPPTTTATAKNKKPSRPPPSSSSSTSTALPSLAYAYTPISDIKGTALVGKPINIYGVYLRCLWTLCNKFYVYVWCVACKLFYFYVLLCSFLDIAQVVHTYQQAKRTKGSHAYSCSYTLIDPSSVPPPSPSAGLATAPPGVQSVVLVFFANSLASLPPVRRVGDILRLHRVKVRLGTGGNKAVVYGMPTERVYLWIIYYSTGGLFPRQAAGAGLGDAIVLSPLPPSRRGGALTGCCWQRKRGGGERIGPAGEASSR